MDANRENDRKLADKIGLGRSTITGYRKGNAPPRENLEKISKYYGVLIDDLLNKDLSHGMSSKLTNQIGGEYATKQELQELREQIKLGNKMDDLSDKMDKIAAEIQTRFEVLSKKIDGISGMSGREKKVK